MLEETVERINFFHKKLELQKEQTDFEGKLAQYKTQRQREKTEAVAEFEAFKKKAKENEVGVIQASKRRRKWAISSRR